MLKSWLIAVGGMTLMLVFWAGVQIAWRRFFPEAGHDSDVLAARGSGCSAGGCSCFGPVCKMELQEKIKSGESRSTHQ